MALAAQAVATPSAQPSKLFASVLEGFDPDHRLTVLDVGLGLPESLDFFSAYRCRLHFLDLFDESVIHEQQQVEDESELQQQFTALLSFPEGTRFDVCLFWDFLNYLDKRAVRAFTAALKPWLHPATRAHAMGTLNDRTALPYCEYGIAGPDEFTMRARPGRQGTCYAHPQAELAKLLDGLDIHKAMLLSDGRLEMRLGAAL